MVQSTESVSEARSPTERLDEAVSPRLSWMTPRGTILFLLVWMAGFTLGSIAISNPFASESTASATPNYWHVMYLHGLLIGMVGLVSIVALDVFETCCSDHVRVGIVAGVVGATLFASIGGIFDRTVPGDEVAMWTQIVGFFFLDEILILLMLGFWQGWRAKLPSSHTVPYIAGWMAAASMLWAAVMGHIAGWILEFHSHPFVITDWAKWAGEDWGTLRDNLIGSHSHDMAVASMALLLSVAVYKFGYLEARGVARNVSRFGMGMVSIGVFWMTGLYVAMGVTSWAVAAYFTSAGDTNGIAGDDLVTGIFVMGGGLLALWPLIVRFALKARSWTESALPVAAAWAWTGIIVGVVIGGYWIEESETFFGAGAKGSPGAVNDNIFLWVHQDIGLFVLPTLFAVLLVADHLVGREYRGAIGWTAIAAVTMLLIGGGVWVFANPDKFGAGYALATIGLVMLGFSVAITVVSGALGQSRVRLVPRLHGRAVDAMGGGGAAPTA